MNPGTLFVVTSNLEKNEGRLGLLSFSAGCD